MKRRHYRHLKSVEQMRDVLTCSRDSPENAKFVLQGDNVSARLVQIFCCFYIVFNVILTNFVMNDLRVPKPV